LAGENNCYTTGKEREENTSKEKESARNITPKVEEEKKRWMGYCSVDGNQMAKEAGAAKGGRGRGGEARKTTRNRAYERRKVGV